MTIATFGLDISSFTTLLVIGGIVGGGWVGGVVEELGPFVDISVSRFSVLSVKFAFCFLVEKQFKHMAISERGCNGNKTLIR